MQLLNLNWRRCLLTVIGPLVYEGQQSIQSVNLWTETGMAASLDLPAAALKGSTSVNRFWKVCLSKKSELNVCFRRCPIRDLERLLTHTDSSGKAKGSSRLKTVCRGRQRHATNNQREAAEFKEKAEKEWDGMGQWSEGQIRKAGEGREQLRNR